MFGKLTLSAIPFDQPIIMGAGAFMGLVVLGILAALTITGRWKWLWTQWLTTVDHKTRRDVHNRRADHAAARLRGRDHDAQLALSYNRRLPAAAPL